MKFAIRTNNPHASQDFDCESKVSCDCQLQVTDTMYMEFDIPMSFSPQASIAAVAITRYNRQAHSVYEVRSSKL